MEGGCQEINRIETPGEDFHMLLMTLDRQKTRFGSP